MPNLITRIRDVWREPVPDQVAEVIHDPARQTPNLIAATVGFVALAAFAAHEGAHLALGVYCTTIIAAFLPAPLHRIGQIIVFAAFVIACTGGDWMTATMIAVISSIRYITGYLALRADERTHAYITLPPKGDPDDH